MSNQPTLIAFQPEGVDVIYTASFHEILYSGSCFHDTDLEYKDVQVVTSFVHTFRQSTPISVYMPDMDYDRSLSDVGDEMKQRVVRDLSFDSLEVQLWPKLT